MSPGFHKPLALQDIIIRTNIHLCHQVTFVKFYPISWYFSSKCTSKFWHFLPLLTRAIYKLWPVFLERLFPPGPMPEVGYTLNLSLKPESECSISSSELSDDTIIRILSYKTLASVAVGQHLFGSINVSLRDEKLDVLFTATDFLNDSVKIHMISILLFCGYICFVNFHFNSFF